MLIDTEQVSAKSKGKMGQERISIPKHMRHNASGIKSS